MTEDRYEPPANSSDQYTTSSRNTKKGQSRSWKSKAIKKGLASQKVILKHCFNASLWTLQENHSYMSFLIQNSQLFTLSKIQKRDLKINVLMSQAIKTRSADQCRSHHQKMMKYHTDIPSIIAYISELKENHQQNQPSQNSMPLLTLQQLYQDDLEMKDFMMDEDYFQKESFCEKLMSGDLACF